MTLKEFCEASRDATIVVHFEGKKLYYPNQTKEIEHCEVIAWRVWYMDYGKMITAEIIVEIGGNVYETNNKQETIRENA